MANGIKILFVSLLVILLVLGGCSIRETVAPIDGDNVLILKSCNLIDSTGANLQKNVSIAIAEDKIIKIGSFDIPKTAKVIDVAGRYVLPGFINAHVHYAYNSNNSRNWLKAGVTTVRDLDPCGLDDYLKVRDRMNVDPYNAFIVASTHMLTVPGGYGSEKVDSPEDAEKKIADYADKKVDIVKFVIEDFAKGRVMPKMDKKTAKAIVDSAHKHNLRATVHVTHEWNLEEALYSGADDFAHMSIEPVEETVIKKIVARGVYWVPTLEVYKRTSEIYKMDLLTMAQRNLENFYKAGGKIAFGNDFGGAPVKFDDGFPITEVRIMKEAGMSNMDIVISATKNAAYVCGLEKKLGTIEAGKQADILIIDGNPLDNIENLTNTWMVIHKGVIVVGPAK